MKCEVAFLQVGNADSIVIRPESGSAVVVDVPNLLSLSDWLKNKPENSISRIYITHPHRDHFTPLVDLVPFLEDWIKCGTVKEVCLPYLVYMDALKKARSSKKTDPNYARLAHALARIKQLSRIIDFIPITRHSNPYTHENLEIHALHPSQIFIEEHLEKIGGGLNEISVVLRVTYGHFATLLLADIQDAGLKECVDLSLINQNEFIANVVKIPHHGAWPKNGDDLKQLLETINPEIAVLSVGSNNKYGHVVPELFNLLLNLKNDNSKQLKQFICTEITRTCIHSASERAKMGKSGLPKPKPCAGEITILAETNGQWHLRTETDHDNVISTLGYPACQGSMDFGN